MSEYINRPSEQLSIPVLTEVLEEGLAVAPLPPATLVAPLQTPTLASAAWVQPPVAALSIPKLSNAELTQNILLQYQNEWPSIITQACQNAVHIHMQGQLQQMAQMVAMEVSGVLEEQLRLWLAAQLNQRNLGG